jgi:signal transduction histidine kinase
LLLLAVFIGVATVLLSRKLAAAIASEEQKKVKIWAKAEQIITDLEEPETDITFHLDVVKSNSTIPAILVDENGKIKFHINLDSIKSRNPAYLEKKLAEFKATNDPILIAIDKGIYHRVYYGESSVLRQLRYYPYVVLGVVGLFIIVSYFAFNFSRRAEQNQVWVGLAKETAHQLGTPITSLMGWVEYLEMELGKLPNQAGDEMRKDVKRLNIITERFSKIGSEPNLQMVDINRALQNSMDYMKGRMGHGVEFELNLYNRILYVDLNVNLFDWVIENLIKNGIDAMEGKGKLTFTVNYRNHHVFIDIMDTGKGIARNRFKTIFKPGFTTKKRGWGLGLSLARRIIVDYHKGQIFVKESIPNTRTVFRIQLNEVKV